MKFNHLALAALLAMGGSAFAGNTADCHCSKECHEACAKGGSDKCDCKSCDKAGKCDHGKCAHGKCDHPEHKKADKK